MQLSYASQRKQNRSQRADRVCENGSSKQARWLERRNLLGLLVLLASVACSPLAELTAATFAAPISATKTPAEESASRSEVPETRLQEIFGGDTPGSLDELKAMESHFQGLVEKVTPAVVGVRVGQSQGSGVIISRDGYVLTAGHVVGRANLDATFILPDGRKVKGKTLGANSGIDSGLMKITEEGSWPYLDMGDSSLLAEGQWVMAVGHPGGYEEGRSPVVRVGRVLTKNGRLVRTDCVLVGGDSGGPLFDMDGRVIGINSRIGQELTANIHVPVNTYVDTWDRLAAGEEWGRFGRMSRAWANRPWIGIRGDRETEAARIAEVVEGSPAAESGLQAGDVIVTFADVEVDSFTALQQAILARKPGDEVKIVVQRESSEVTLSLVIGKWRE